MDYCRTLPPIFEPIGGYEHPGVIEVEDHDSHHPKKSAVSYSKQLVDLTADMVLTDRGGDCSFLSGTSFDVRFPRSKPNSSTREAPRTPQTPKTSKSHKNPRYRRPRPSKRCEISGITGTNFHGPSPPQRSNRVHELDLELIEYHKMKLRKRKTVELFDGSFIRIVSIKNKLTEDGSSEIFLQGPQFLRSRNLLGFLPLKKNEVAMSSLSESVPLSKVLKTRILILTNANFPGFRDITGVGDADEKEGRLICRWAVNLVSKTEGYLWRLKEDEADKEFRVAERELRDQWRGDLMRAKIMNSNHSNHTRKRQKRQRDGTLKQINLNDNGAYGEPKGPYSHYTGNSFTKDRFMQRTTDPALSGCHAQVSAKEARFFNTPRAPGAPPSPPTLRWDPYPEPMDMSPPPLESFDQLFPQKLTFGGASTKFGLHSPPGTPFSKSGAEFWDNGSHIRNENAPAFPGSDTSLPTLSRSERLTSNHSVRANPLSNPIQREDAPSKLRKVTTTAGVGPEGYNPTTNIPPRQPVFSSARETTYTFGDAFCGGGGMSSGARAAGFINAWSFDSNHEAVTTYRRNFPQCITYHSTANDFLTFRHPELLVDVVHLSPPCQPHSPAHTIAGKDDDNNEASLFCVRQCLQASRPRMVTLEQTDGLLNRPEWFRSLVMMFTDLGFSLSWKVLHGVEYGVPQTRKRLFLLAASPGEELPEFPTPTHAHPKAVNTEGREPPRTVRDAISGIPAHASCHVHNFSLFPEGPRLSSVNLDLPLMSTILASGGPYDVHPNGRRPFTPRELACLQTFPISHIFYGSPFQKKKQIGNAVPPILAEALLKEVRKTLEKADRSRKKKSGQEDPFWVPEGSRGRLARNPICIAD
ncbi:S-adenosyl-L-methionine-dependent methyltransferase [Choiromyces venosus 120613-1]|uniref:DNA (cytosine-5-)-methyltransferase n=1 Tax=Choiromyces venosus 120613-1 TaxID=1336337 RepID=A0A3N4JU98_9PEZI|nr:S-adenosyl-L-methionine-dependent methyltransferase [Choiromyces venosus 120613-1]